MTLVPRFWISYLCLRAPYLEMWLPFLPDPSSPNSVAVHLSAAAGQMRWSLEVSGDIWLKKTDRRKGGLCLGFKQKQELLSS